MTRKRIVSFGGAIAVAVALVTGSGAATGASPIGATLDLSSKAKVHQYLRSIHMNPKGVVIQRGLRNYAGPNCPGKGWTCTRVHRVVQIASGHGKNSFRCAFARCVVVQVTKSFQATNSANCSKTTGITQSCSISQTSTSADNRAVVVEIATKMSGLTQTASQTASITQNSGSGSNQACVLQTTNVNGSTVAKKGQTVTVTLEAHQSISIAQNSATGNNTVQGANGNGGCGSDTLEQTQLLSSTASGSASITQLQNATANGPNLALDIQQNQSPAVFGSATGNNTAKFSQTNTLSAAAVTPTGPVVQTQSSNVGGIQAKVNQFSHGNSPTHGLSTAHAIQNETQCVHAQSSGTPTCTPGTPPSYSLTQKQFGPASVSSFTDRRGSRGRGFHLVRKGPCCSVQGDNPNDTFTVEQHSTQQADDGATQKNSLQGDCTTSGNCTVHQQTDIDGQHSENTQSGHVVNATTDCSGSSCTTSTANGPQFSASNTNAQEADFGGMRGNGTGSLTVSGVTGPVARALLYWNGPTNSSSPTANANVTFNGTPVTGTNIGFASDNCWSFQNSQSYQADVTALVSGNGTYSLSNFTKPGVEVNGVSLLVFYNDGNPSNDRNFTVWSGNDSNIASTFDPAGWDETLTGVQYPGSGPAFLDFIVSDGQVFADDALVLNGVQLVPAGNIFQGDSVPGGPGPPPPDDVNGNLWDAKEFDITSFLTAGSNNLHLTTGLAGDCLSLVAFAANVPASAPVTLNAARQLFAARADATPAHSVSAPVSNGHGGISR